MYVNEFFSAVDDLFNAIRTTQGAAIHGAGLMIANAMALQGAIHVMDTGHLLRHEAFYRAGGLRSFVPLDFTVTVENPVDFRNVERTREETEALVVRQTALALDSSKAVAGDVLIINSNSGRTSNVIEAAIQAGQRGLSTVGIASRQQMDRCEAVHPSGKKLFDVCDLCIDNCGPYGDAMVPVANNEPICPASGLAAAYILWAIQAEAVQHLEDRGLRPTVLRSVHTGGEAYLEEQGRRYREQGY